ncbi:hypothetical protein ACJJID_00055 (plasmid) [Microbulbifer sp. CnH-101-G]|uniref:hypothetical protein n=1 Tax=Microbulbifer sp. CnH-101-G TaxID=3243393 RepID=UPI00403A04F2
MGRLIGWMFGVPKKRGSGALRLSLQLNHSGGQLLLQWGPRKNNQDRSHERQRQTGV